MRIPSKLHMRPKRKKSVIAVKNTLADRPVDPASNRPVDPASNRPVDPAADFEVNRLHYDRTRRQPIDTHHPGNI